MGHVTNVFNGEEEVKKEAESRVLPGRKGLEAVTVASQAYPWDGRWWWVAWTPTRKWTKGRVRAENKESAA